MADASLPGATYNENPTGLPLETQPVGEMTGLEASFGAAMRSSLGASWVTQAAGLTQSGEMVPYDTVKGVFENQKLDPSVFPAGQPVRRGEALAVFGQQLAIQKDQDLADRAHLGILGGVAGFVGGLADPAILGSALIGGPLLGAAREGLGIGVNAVKTGAPLVARVAAGAAEGGAGVAAYEKAEQLTGTAQGDRDITTGQIVHDSLWGSVLGGALKGAVGARPARVDLEPMREMIVGAENSAGYAKAHGISPNDVVSSKGAVGIHQITPALAESLGFSGDTEMLKNPDYNAQVAEANLEKLYKRYGSDPEAIAIAWNAGPGVADKFIKAGRDRSVLPKETQGYLDRIDKIRGTGEVAAPGATEPVVSVSARDNQLVPARKMPDGSVMYGDVGGVHSDLMTDDEIDGKEKVDPATMGFAEKDGPWMSREQAGQETGEGGRLEAAKYGMKQAGETVPAFGTRGIPDATDVAAMKTAVAQADRGSEINVEPVIKGMVDEQNGLKADPNELAKVIPERNGELAPPAIKDKLAALNEQVKNAKPEPALPTTGRVPHPAIAEIQRLAQEATEEAANIHAGMTGEVAGAEGNKFEAYMKSAEEDFNKSEGAEAKPEFQKALEAAVQCGLKNGVE